MNILINRLLNRVKKNSAQYVLEYCFGLAAILLGLLLMSQYIGRSAQGRLVEQTKTMGAPYAAGTSSIQLSISKAEKIITTPGAGEEITDMQIDSTFTRMGTENIAGN